MENNEYNHEWNMYRQKPAYAETIRRYENVKRIEIFDGVSWCLYTTIDTISPNHCGAIYRRYPLKSTDL